MYRKGEGKIFPSPEDVPTDEGWQDVPVPDEPESEEAPKRRGRPPKVQEEEPQ